MTACDLLLIIHYPHWRCWLTGV